jgi:ribosomal-protein-alanine N-acetyltransferase
MLETERLIIRKFAPEDLDKLIELRLDEEVNKYLGGTRLQNPEAIAKRLQFYMDCHEKFGFGMSAMIWKETGEMIGWSGLQPLETTGEIEVGYGMAKEFWRRGIGLECARAWLEYGFNTVGLERIVAVAIPENTGSRRIMEKLGMTYYKTDISYGEKCVFYEIGREKFLSVNTK